MFRVSGFRLLDSYCFRILELEVLGLRVSGILGLRGLIAYARALWGFGLCGFTLVRFMWV